jgi:16S rRNA processing protein RimM
LICLGAIVGVHGIKGEVKVKSWTQTDDELDSYGALCDQTGQRSFELKIVGHSKELLRCKIKGINDRTTAESLIGTGLYVQRDLLPETDAEEYYQADLIGLSVLNAADHTKAGTVSGIYNFGAGDILEIRTENHHTEMIPFTKEYVPDVCIREGYVTVQSTTMNFAKEDDDEG